MAQVAFRQLVHAVPDVARLKHVGHQHGVVDGFDVNAVTRQHLDIVLEVLADLEDARVFKQGPQSLDGSFER